MIAAYVALLVFITAVMLGVVWWRRRRAPTFREVAWEDVLAEATQGGYRLITTEELARRYQKDPQRMLLVDTRSEGEYRAGHIQGAENLPLAPTWWGRWRSRRFLAAILGPDKERLVVFY